MIFLAGSCLSGKCGIGTPLAANKFSGAADCTLPSPGRFLDGRNPVFWPLKPRSSLTGRLVEWNGLVLEGLVGNGRRVCLAGTKFALGLEVPGTVKWLWCLFMDTKAARGSAETELWELKDGLTGMLWCLTLRGRGFGVVMEKNEFPLDVKLLDGLCLWYSFPTARFCSYFGILCFVWKTECLMGEATVCLIGDGEYDTLFDARCFTGVEYFRFDGRDSVADDEANSFGLRDAAILWMGGDEYLMPGEECLMFTPGTTDWPIAGALPEENQTLISKV